MSRPTKLTDTITLEGGDTTTVRDQILKDLQAGVYQSHAAERAGVHASTLARWVEAGEREGSREPYRSFAVDFYAARAAAAARNVALVQQAARKGDWRAASWFLERSFPDIYGPQPKVTVAGDPDQPVRVATGPAEEGTPGMADDDRTAGVLAALSDAGVLPAAILAAAITAVEETTD